MRTHYRITMAVAGFGPEEVELTQHGPELIGNWPEEARAERTPSALPWPRRRKLQAGVQARRLREGCASFLENGLLSIELVREIPEEMKPRRIAVQGANATGDRRQGRSDRPGSQART